MSWKPLNNSLRLSYSYQNVDLGLRACQSQYPNLINVFYTILNSVKNAFILGRVVHLKAGVTKLIWYENGG